MPKIKGGVEYTNRSGETLWSIAKRTYGEGPLWKHIPSHPKNQKKISKDGKWIVTGMKIYLPKVDVESGQLAESSNVSAGRQQLADQHMKKSSAMPKIKGGVDYTIRGGDTLWSIAKNVYGAGPLWKYIPLHPKNKKKIFKNGEQIFAGMKIYLPKVDIVNGQLAESSRVSATARLSNDRHIQSAGKARFVHHEAFKIELDELPSKTDIIQTGSFIIKITHSLTGEVLLQKVGNNNLHLETSLNSVAVKYESAVKEFTNSLNLEFTPGKVALSYEHSNKFGEIKIDVLKPGTFPFESSPTPVKFYLTKNKDVLVTGKIGFKGEIQIFPQDNRNYAFATISQMDMNTQRALILTAISAGAIVGYIVFAPVTVPTSAAYISLAVFFSLIGVSSTIDNKKISIKTG